MNQKVDHHTGGYAVHPRPQTPQGEPVATPGTILLINISLVYKSDIEEIHEN